MKAGQSNRETALERVARSRLARQLMHHCAARTQNKTAEEACFLAVICGICFCPAFNRQTDEAEGSTGHMFSIIT